MTSIPGIEATKGPISREMDTFASRRTNLIIRPSVSLRLARRDARSRNVCPACLSMESNVVFAIEMSQRLCLSRKQFTTGDKRTKNNFDKSTAKE